ncbi:hypothetical protein B9Z55_025734 [Caenorhabditis nigoni]|nr:hypothetical protein B9Z55_025734 [Caenorhabditis nigoni]
MRQLENSVAPQRQRDGKTRKSEPGSHERLERKMKTWENDVTPKKTVSVREIPIQRRSSRAAEECGVEKAEVAPRA